MASEQKSAPYVEEVPVPVGADDDKAEESDEYEAPEDDEEDAEYNEEDSAEEDEGDEDDGLGPGEVRTTQLSLFSSLFAYLNLSFTHRTSRLC